MKIAAAFARLFRYRPVSRKVLSLGRYKMSTFVSRISAVTGKLEWISQDENYDFHQEVARSAYADMLHDTERNQKYFQALQDAVRRIHRRGQSANVLDIGTGTGLLAMMAVECGADSVTACEGFQPVAACAQQVIEDNGFADKIKLIPKRSTELTVGPDGDLEERANILVTEVFDTELIGEGAITTFHHAHESLLQEDCIVVPSAANVYVQLVHSETVQKWNKFTPIKVVGDDDIIPPPEMCNCQGAAAVHDLQLDQLPCDQFTALTKPVRVFRFDYTGKSDIKFEEYSWKHVEAIASGTIHAIFMWWDLEMDMDDKLVVSCAPRWAHPSPESMQWRDHWMQAIYYPPREMDIDKRELITIHSCYDEYSFWFDVSTQSSHAPRTMPLSPICTCGAHVACSRTRIGMLNSRTRQLKYIEALKKVVKPESRCLCLSDSSLLPLILAKLGVEQVYTIEQHPMGQRMVESFVEHNVLESSVKILERRPEHVTPEDLDGHKVDLIVGDPFFNTSILPWHNIYFWYARTELASAMSKTHVVMPCMATMKAIAVEFKDLWKIRAPVGNCEGFDLSFFDTLVQEASDLTDDKVEAQPLWEYPGVPLSDEFELLRLDFLQPLSGIRTVERQGVMEVWSSGTCNGIAIWMDFHLDRTTTITTGLVSAPRKGKPLQWDVYARQGVHLFKRPVVVQTDGDKVWRIRYKVTFRPKSGEFEFDFKVI